VRILAIRGKNLASLAAEFEIALDRPPLADAGIFAITGKTGAGKSTTLDALCLALFDRVPRLPGGHGVEIGREDDAHETRLKSNDVRSILRRGAGEGFAEVDFRGVDGARYRARWSVRRARGRAEGRFQAQQMTLRSLESGEDLGGTKTEVLERIQRLLGLSFEQFRRSVLLAQGDFAAFLQASPGDRAELLERITGTAIYGELSRAAHRRAGEERQALDLVQARLRDQTPLDEAQRQGLDAELVAATGALDDVTRDQRQHEQADAWYQAEDRLRAELDGAEASRRQAEAALAEAAPRRLVLERSLRLEPLRLPLTLFDQADAALESARRELDTAQGELVAREASAAQVEQTATEARAAHQSTERHLQETAPALNLARQLDTRIQGAREQLQRAEADAAAVEASVAASGTELENLMAHSAEAAEQARAAETWLDAHQGLAPLAAQWASWKRELDRYAVARAEHGLAERACQEASESGAALARSREAKDADLAAIRETLASLTAEQETLRLEHERLDPEGLAKDRDATRARLGAVDTWRRLADQAQAVKTQIECSQRDLAAERERQAAAQGRLKQIADLLPSLEAGLAEASGAHRRLLLASAEGAETLRGALIPGEPCPVCGSEAHPWAHRAADALRTLAAEQEARVAEVQGQTDSLRAERERQTTVLAESCRREATLSAQLEGQEAELADRMQVWNACEPDPLRGGDVFDVALIARLTEEHARLESTLTSIAGQESRAREIDTRMRTRATGVETQRARAESEQTALAELHRQIAETTRRAETAGTNRDRAGRTMAEIAELLAAPLAALSDWRDRLDADPAALRDAAEREVDTWLACTAQRDEARAAHQRLEPDIAQARARLHAAREELARRTHQVDQARGALDRLESERGSQLDGRPADAVEQALKGALAEARTRMETAAAALGQAREALTAAQGVVATRRQALTDAESTWAEREQGLRERVTAHELTLDSLREALIPGPEWVERERAELQALSDAHAQAVHLVAERQRRLTEHRSGAAPGLTREALAEDRGTLPERLRIAQEHWARVHGRLAEDDRRRQATAEIRLELDRQQAVWETWESLRELIGSADGSRFRNFAQGLTLDLLVAHANRQLDDLTRRYALERAPGSEMELQVIDREMGDEVRGIHSLSGGESFLASLALALGLASLTSERVQVESLFIDEGFGALDADSLDMAIACLDALYSLGRQVGVISHVGTLVERIGVRVEVRKAGGGRSDLAVRMD
jgi:exonuclease SbcC